LKGVIKQAENTSKKIIKIKDLIIVTENDIQKLNVGYHKITTILFSQPYQTLSNFEEQM
jgi:hypothetical protein